MSLEAFMSFKRRLIDEAFESLARHEAWHDQLLIHGWGAPPPSEAQVERYRTYLNRLVDHETAG